LSPSNQVHLLIVFDTPLVSSVPKDSSYRLPLQVYNHRQTSHCPSDNSCLVSASPPPFGCEDNILEKLTKILLFMSQFSYKVLYIIIITIFVIKINYIYNYMNKVKFRSIGFSPLGTVSISLFGYWFPDLVSLSVLYLHHLLTSYQLVFRLLIPLSRITRYCVNRPFCLLIQLLCITLDTVSISLFGYSFTYFVSPLDYCIHITSQLFGFQLFDNSVSLHRINKAFNYWITSSTSLAGYHIGKPFGFDLDFYITLMLLNQSAFRL